MSAAVVGVRITVGRFSLAIGAEEGTSAAPAPKPERRFRGQLAEARKEAGRTARAAQALETAGTELESTIEAVERADELVSMLAKGLTLDPRVLEQQVGRLLDLVDRADREGRLDDELRLARALVALLALVPRWLALVEVLQRLAATAAAAGDAVAEGWAEHELGTLALSTDDAEAATSHLETALERREAAGDAAGAAVTRRNLELVPIAAAGARSERTRIRRRRIALALGVVAAVVLLGVGAAAVWADDPADGEPAGTTPAESVAETTAETTEPADTEGPSVEVRVPAEEVRGSIEVAAAADDPSGVASVSFTALGEGTPVELGEDTAAPFVATWDTTTVPDGAYRIVAMATDGAGNEGESAPASLLVDNAAPTVTQGTPEAGEGSYRLSAEAEDAGSGVESVRFEFGRLDSSDANVDEVEWEALDEVETPSAGSTYEATFDLEGREPGFYVFRAVGVDEVGNEGVSNIERIAVSFVD